MALIDPRTNRPFDTSMLSTEQGGASVTGIRTPHATHPADRLSPARLAQLLRSSEAGDMLAYLSLAEEMEERDSHYRGVISKRKWAVSQLPVTVEAVSDNAVDQKAATLLREVLAGDTLEEDLFDILDGIGKGYSATEIIWDRSGKEWRPERLEWRDPRWFRFDPIDMKTLRLVGDNGAAEDLMPYKWIVHYPKSKSGIPIRGGIARPVSWCYLFKSMDVAAWVQFVELFGHPIRIGKWGPGAKPEDKQTLLRALQAIGRNFAAAIPESMMIELIEAKSSGGADLHQKHADWLDRQISKAVLGSTAGTDAIAGGHAVGKEHRDVEADIERSDARQLAAALKKGLARPLIDLNFGRDVPTPHIVIARPDSEDLKALMEMTGNMIDRGMRVGMSTVRDKLGWEDPGEDEEVLKPLNRSAGASEKAPGQDSLVKAPDSQVKQERASAQLLKLFTAAAKAPSSDSLDDLANDELQEWEKMVTPMVDPVRTLLKEVSSIDEFLAKLPELAEIIGSDALTESLSRTLFAAQLAGGADLPIDD